MGALAPKKYWICGKVVMSDPPYQRFYALAYVEREEIVRKKAVKTNRGLYLSSFFGIIIKNAICSAIRADLSGKAGKPYESTMD